MQHGIILPNVGVYGNPRLLADLAYVSEEAGWDGVFLWDTIHYIADGQPVSDAWIALAAVAMRTEHIKIGLQVAAPTRRRPWKLAREAVTLDHLSNGRFILGVGLGDNTDKGFTAFGEETDPKKRARMLDESLDILQGLWSGRPFSYQGEFYHVDEVTFLPSPIQQPRIPIWVAGTWPRKKPMERAARFDGAGPMSSLHDGSYAPTPAEVGDIKRFIDERRASTSPFDIAVTGLDITAARRDERAHAKLRAYAEAGATWCLYSPFSMMDDASTLRTLLREGPPALP